MLPKGEPVTDTNITNSGTSLGPVNSYNECSLEAVIVGVIDEAVFPPWNTIDRTTAPPGEWDSNECRST